MFWLVQTDVAASGKADAGERPPPFFLNRRADHFLSREISHLGFQVGAHEIELVAIVVLCRMRGCLCRRQCEDQPAVAGIDGCQPQHVAKEDAVSLGILAINDDMFARDRDGVSLASPFYAVDLR
jgi:hypothetical protein